VEIPPRDLDCATIDQPMRSAATRRVLSLEAAGFAAVDVLIWMNEYLDLPHRLLGAPATPWRPSEVMIEAGFVSALGLAVILVSQLMFRRLAYLESLLILCASCERVSDNGRWMRFEEFVAGRDRRQTTHGMCPDCFDSEMDAEPTRADGPAVMHAQMSSRMPPVRTLLVAGLCGLITILALDEYWDLPARTFGSLPTPIRHHEFAIEVIAAVAVFTLILHALREPLRRMQQLTHLLTMCAWCRRVQVKGEWMSIDEFLKRRDDVRTSVSLCPECYAKTAARNSAA
jgi:hypothetical protein